MAHSPSSAALAPFVLLDDAGGGEDSRARLYRAPGQVIIARRPQDVAPALTAARAALAQGKALAGWLAYEAGLPLEPRLAALCAPRTGADGPLVWLGVFDGWEEMPAAAVPAWLAAETRSPGPHRLGPMEPQLSPGGYARAFAAIRAGIEAGDIYQANFTLPLAGSWRGDPLALYASLRGAGGAAHGGVVFDGANWLLSLSPELFFACADGDIRVKPMKGTRPRGATPDEDAALAAQLRASVKDRAENLMILDLMRNDLARVAEAGSVRVESAFAVEHYPSVHQMVSTATARLAPGLGPVDVLEALHPCGSVTGAPKIRAMELIAQHERDPRGAYCGALGHIDPAGTAAFNVAIRTLRLTGDGQGAASGGGGRAVLGVGSAIVADSDAMDEWRECMVKGGFVRQAAAGADGAQFDLIETMAFAPDEGIPLLERHLERIAASARALGFAFDRHGARNAIHALCFAAEAPARLRLLLARSGAISLEIGPAPVPFAAPLPCILLPAPVDRLDWRLAHKTSERGFYEAGLAAARAAGAGEALFVGEGGCLTEGCFTSLFVERDGQLLTPPLADGLLPGVLRAQLLADGRAREARLRPEDLAGGFYLGNALRGLIPAVLL